MKKITFKEFFSKLNEINFPNFDLIVAIGNGGIVPAAFIQEKLKIEMQILYINYRDKDHNPIYNEPKQLSNLEVKKKSILLVDDVSRTGKTLQKAKEILKNNKIKTFLINGRADFNLFDEKQCLKMPWR